MRGREFNELKAFLCVAEARSFRRAAERLGMSASALSHTIRALEARLGARLLNRTTRSVAPTEAGQVLFDRLRPAVEEIGAAIRDVAAAQDRPRGVVRINLPRIAARLLVTPMLPAFRARYPDVRLDLVIDDDITDIVGAGFDAGIRSGALVQQDMIAIRLSPDLRMAVVGSPAYFAGRAIPRHPRDLREHACLTYGWDSTGVLQRWEFQGPDAPSSSMSTTPSSPTRPTSCWMPRATASAWRTSARTSHGPMSTMARSSMSSATGPRPCPASTCTTSTARTCRRR